MAVPVLAFMATILSIVMTFPCSCQKARIVQKWLLTFIMFALLVAIPFPGTGPGFYTIQTLIKIELYLPILIAILAIDKIKKINKNKYIKIELNQIKIYKKYQFSEKIVCYQVSLLNDKSFANFLKEFPSMEDVNENEIDIGRVYLQTDTEEWVFEDRLAVNRTSNDLKAIDDDFKDTVFTANNNYKIAPGFLPFLTNKNGWKIRGEGRKVIIFDEVTNEKETLIDTQGELIDAIEKCVVKDHYDKCNLESIEKQKILKFAHDKHQKFALMDQITRSCNHASLCSMIVWGLDNDCVFAVNELKKNELVKIQTEGSFVEVTLTALGKKTDDFGYRTALEFNKTRKQEKWLELRRNLTVWTSIAAAIFSFVYLMREVFFSNE